MPSSAVHNVTDPQKGLGQQQNTNKRQSVILCPFHEGLELAISKPAGKLAQIRLHFIHIHSTFQIQPEIEWLGPMATAALPVVGDEQPADYCRKSSDDACIMWQFVIMCFNMQMQTLTRFMLSYNSQDSDEGLIHAQLFNCSIVKSMSCLR